MGSPWHKLWETLKYAQVASEVLTLIVDKPSVIPEEDVEKYGIHRGQVKKQVSQGGGYIVYVEVMHHLHCLVP